MSITTYSLRVIWERPDPEGESLESEMSFQEFRFPVRNKQRAVAVIRALEEYKDALADPEVSDIALVRERFGIPLADTNITVCREWKRSGNVTAEAEAEFIDWCILFNASAF